MYHFFKNNQANKYFVYFLLFSLFCSGPFAYSAELFKNYVEIKLGSSPNKYVGNAETIPNTTLANNELELPSKSTVKNSIDRKNSTFDNATNLAVYNADLKEGNIGINKKGDFDFIYDNIFKVNINENELAGKEIYLSYDIKGIDKSTLPSKSVNFNKVVGGYVVKFSNEWQNVEEKINADWLKNGLNSIYFTLPNDALYSYKIKNLKIFAKEKRVNHLIELKNLIGYKSDDKNIYLNGFINLTSQIENSGYTLSVNDKSVKIIENQFEDKIINVENKDVVLKLFKNNVLVDKIDVKVVQFIKADRNYDLETLDSKTSVVSNVEVAKNYALYEDKTYFIEELRNIDVPQFESSFINVTKNKTAYRVNNLKVKDSTAFKLFMEYDSLLIPNGYTEKDIQTFRFDTDYKKWIPVEKDSLIESKNVVVALSNKGGDYVNGIIQVPESPQTSSFTPTMMSDIKAADPAAEMTIISPPEVSQKGDANISYPIKTPSGRNGMQPSVGISYNSDGGNGWLGQGWNMSAPAISIDSKWGTPTFDSSKESEMYTLNGEQLMYPKIKNFDNEFVDWMPNRHYDESNTSGGVIVTTERDRVSNQIFTPRKQGSFAKIERIGNSTSQYIWKVTSTDGTISWYGGKNSVESNAIIKNSQNNIVHWAIYMIEDINGNTVKYEYSNYQLASQNGQNANLTDGKVFNVKNIKYTGYHDADYQYEVVFNSTSTIRQDTGINARLGVKQIEPYLLDNIVVQKIGASLPIRSYKLNYGSGKFNKEQLKSVAEYDKNGNFFYEHKFDYYDDVSLNDSDVYFADGIEEVICEEVPCLDTDNDGTCDERDDCRTVPGPISNNGCPEQGTRCFNTNANIPYASILETGTNVIVNGVLLPGSPFATFLSFKNAMELNHPTCSFISLSPNTFLIKIENTNNVYTNISFVNFGQQKSYDFIDCGFGKQTNGTSYKQYFSDLASQNQFTLNDGVNPNNPCPDIITNENFLISGFIPSFDSSAGILGSSESEGRSTGFYLGLGIGKNKFTKMTTFGYQWNWGNDKSLALTSLIDINGDGLDDIVIKQGNQLFYKKHIVTRTYNSANEPIILHSFGVKKPITGIDNFYRSFGRNNSGNFQITFGLKKIGGFVGWDKSKSKSETDMYFTDGNGDGLMDIVRDGVVYFNRLDSSGNPEFIPDSKGTENLIIAAEPVTITPPAEYNSEDIILPAFDVVKVWEAPADGNIKIDNAIQLTDTTKEAVVSVEIKNALVQCYNTNFQAPFANKQLYSYSVSPTITYSNGTTNPLNNQVLGICKPGAWRIKNFNINGNLLTSSNPNLLYITHGNSLVGFLNQCSNTLPTCINTCYDYSIRSNNSATNIQNWLSNSLNSLNIQNTIYNCNNNSRSYLRNNNSNNLPFLYVYESFNGLSLAFYSTNIINGNILIETSINGVNWQSNFPYLNKPLNSNSLGIVQIGIDTQVYINGNLLGIFNLYNNFNAFKTAFEAQYGTAYNITSPSSSNNYAVSITMNGTTAFSNITLVPVSNPSQNYSYNFSQINCNSNSIINPSPIANTTFGNSPLELTKAETEYAINKWLAEGSEINLPYENTKANYEFDFTNNGIYSNITGNYLLAIDGTTYNWYTNQNTIVTNNGIKNKLFQLSGFNINTLLSQLNQENIERINIERQESQQKAIQWLKDNDSSNNIVSNQNLERTIDQTNCDETPNELCLLYGTQMNASNSSIINTLTTNCSGQTLAVKKGDRIYFRVHSNDNGNSLVNWNPKIQYTNAGFVTTTDANGITPFSSSYADSFILNSKSGLAFPGNSGTTKISWTPLSINPTDKVTFKIIKQVLTANVSNTDDVPTITETEVYKYECLPNITSIVNPAINLLPININNIAVSDSSNQTNISQTNFIFKVVSTSNINWKNSVWKPEVEFTTTSAISPNQNGSNPEGNVTSVIKKNPVPDYDIYRNYPCSYKFEKRQITSSPNQKINVNFNGVFNNSHNGVINFVVKRGSVFKGYKKYKVTNGVPSLDSSYPFALNLPIELGTSGNGIPNEIEIMFTVDDSENDTNTMSLLNALALTNNNIVTITQGNSQNGQSVPKNQIALYQKTDLKFGTLYRSWGQFMYRPANVSNALPTGIANTKLIKEEALQVSMSNSEASQLNTDLNGVSDSMSTADLQAFETSHLNMLNSVAFLPANASRELVNGILTDNWIGFHNENFSSEFGLRAEKLEFSTMDFEQEFPNIEQAVLQTGAYAISKYGTGNSKNFSAGINAFSISGNASVSKDGLSNSLTDYVDFNGDSYPDVVSKDFIQYTKKTGGLRVQQAGEGQNVSTSTSDSQGFGASGSFGKSNQKGGDADSKGYGFDRFDGFNGSSGAGISGSFTNGNSKTLRQWTDINGDGLSDLLVTTGSTTNIKLNYGPTTSNVLVTDWGSLPIFNSKSNGVSGGLGVNIWNGSVEAGVSLTSSWNQTQNTLSDINGDGLLDLIYTDDNLGVKINLGNQFIDKGQWSSNYNLKKESVTVASSLNVGFSFALIWQIGLWRIKFPAMNWNGTPLSTSTNKTMKSLVDYDKDGFVDLVEQVAPNTVKIHHSRIRRTDKLKMVTNPLGGKFTIDYKVQPVTYNNPNPKWAMSSIEVSDNYDKVNDGEDTYKKHFEYKDGKYDRREREFYGYNEVRVLDYATNEDGNEEVYRTSVSVYNNTSYFLNGLPIENYIIKGSDENQKYNRTLNTYKVYTLNSTNDEIQLNDEKPHMYDVGGHEGRRSAAVLLTKTRSEVYELNPTADLVTEVEFTYDNKGRITEYLNKGDIVNTTDDYKSAISYHSNLTALNIINIPQSIEVTLLDGNIVKRKRTTEVNSANGKITKVSAINGTESADTEMQYDVYGNLTNIKYPNNISGDTMSYTYTYDTTYKKYIEKVKDNVFGYESTTLYNSDLDKPTEVIDITGINKTLYFYDNFGRTTKVLGPKEILANLDYTVKFEYFPYINLLPSNTGVSTTDFMPVAVTQHFDVQHPDNPIETYTFVDGLGRPIQVKKDIELNTGNTISPTYTEALTVSGKTKVDAYSRTIEAFQPWWEEKTPATKFIINEQAVTISSKVIYDELDRVVRSIDEEGNTSTVQFAIAPNINGITCLKTTSDVDQNGTQHIISETYHDATSRLLYTKNVGGTTGSIWTKFKYNAIGELLTYTDAENITTTYNYDMFGRILEVKHPDNGKTLYKYDNVNLVSIQTQNLINSNKFIKYEYDHNRLMSVIFPIMTSGANLSNVKYKYGNSGNETGRVIAIYDATGVQNLKYGVMGETIEVKRTIVAPNLPTRIFTTKFDYDSFNRIQKLVYPDGESVSYLYNKGGNLNKMRTQLNGTDYDYVKQIDYDYFEQKTYMKHGNDTETYYNYSSELRRLQNLNVKAADGQSMFNNKYSYDKVGNITKIKNNAGFNTINYMGGVYDNDYSYDNLNRLTTAKGSFTGYTVGRVNQDNRKEYELAMKYNDTHGIVQKKQLHTTQGYVPIYENSYTNNYAYQANTHKAITITNAETNVVEQFKYDGNGNMLAHTNPDSFRAMFWDESNRLRVLNDNNNQLQHYIYDSAGERTLKASSQIETVYQNGQIASASTTIGLYTTYVSPYMVVDADQRYSKHYFNGSQRVVSKIGEQDISFFENAPLPIAPPTENLQRQNEISTIQSSEETIDFEELKNRQISDFNYYLTQNTDNTTAKNVKINYKEIKKENKETDQNIENNQVNTALEYEEMYYYHSDHLGSGTFLSDFDGNPYQFFLNLPFGESMIEQHSYSGDYTNRYKFNGKELDEETGYYYYGARYYNPKFSIWLSMDPLAEEYPNFNPYAYCYQNPINFIDPTGMEGEESGGTDPYKGGIQVFQAADAKGEVPGGTSRASESFMVGGYDVLPNYVKNDNGKDVFSHYTASVMVNDGEGGKKSRIDYVLGKNDLSHFKKEVKTFAGAANLLFGSGTNLSQGTINILNGKGYGTYIKEQLTNPMNWLVAITGILSLRVGGQALRAFSGKDKALQVGGKPNSIYTYLSSDGKAVSNYIYNSEGKVIFQVDFGKHGNFSSGHGHLMTTPGNLGSGHSNHIPVNKVPAGYLKIPKGVQYSTPPGK